MVVVEGFTLILHFTRCQHSMFSANGDCGGSGGGGCCARSVAGESVTRVTPRDKSRNSNRCSALCSH